MTYRFFSKHSLSQFPTDKIISVVWAEKKYWNKTQTQNDRKCSRCACEYIHVWLRLCAHTWIFITIKLLNWCAILKWFFHLYTFVQKMSRFIDICRMGFQSPILLLHCNGQAEAGGYYLASAFVIWYDMCLIREVAVVAFSECVDCWIIYWYQHLMMTCQSHTSLWPIWNYR